MALNICLTAQKFPILGRASDHGFLWQIAKSLAAVGHKVTIISAKSPLGKAEVVRDNVRVFYLHEGFPNLSHLRFDQAVFKKFHELHLVEKFDIVHSIDKSAAKIARKKHKLHVSVTFDVEATQMAQLVAILAMNQEKVSAQLSTFMALTYKYITTFFGGDRQLLANADGVFVTSPQQRIFLERYYFFPDYYTFVVPYSLEVSPLNEIKEPVELKRKWKIPENSQVVVSLSDMTDPGEVRGILRAFERLAVKKPTAYMMLIGNGPAFKEVEFEVLSLALGSRVLMPGALKAEEISEIISVSDIYVNMSSRTTGFEPGMVEAMTQKKVVLGSELSPISTIIEDGRDGFLLRPADINSLSNLMIELFSGTLAASEIGERAREKIAQIFDSKKMADAIESAFRLILAEPRQR